MPLRHRRAPLAGDPGRRPRPQWARPPGAGRVTPPPHPPGPVPEQAPLGASELLPHRGLPATPTLDAPPGSPWVAFRGRFLRHKVAVASVVVLAGLCVACFGAPLFAPYARAHQDLSL